MRTPDLPVWSKLRQHQQRLSARSMRELFAEDPARFGTLSRTLPLGASGSLLVDFSKQRVDAPALADLLVLAEESGCLAHRDRMFAGEKINSTEDRAVLHVALRDRSGPGSTPRVVDGVDVSLLVRAALEHVRDASEAVRSGRHTGFTGKRITDVVNVGIGGSDLGPVMVTEALAPYARSGPRLHFVSNVDGTHLAEVLRRVDPETTLFLIASKTFTTQETLANARSARAWFLERAHDEAHVAKHFFALSTNEREVVAFGIAKENMFEFWDWVGGRYSLWSSIGLSIAIGVGYAAFEELLDGAHLVDEHFRTAPPAENLPLLFGLLGIWNNNFFDVGAHAVLPYDQYLHRLPAYLQQADMESNGKGVRADGDSIGTHSGPVLFGEPGTNGQHAFYQLIHQGTRVVSCDFLVAARTHNPIGRHHTLLLSNVLAQSEALMRGKTVDEARAELLAASPGADPARRELLAKQRAFTGNRPSTTLLYDLLDPRTLGALIALYEHRIFVMGAVLGLNSFDQWGVELGKQLANAILPELDEGPRPGAHDASTTGLIEEIRRRRSSGSHL
jgi:glucose-6-phosphate isomerase